ncbi:MAG: hypothetical protein VX600_02990 [Candidatus Neomarinimicrobiota bacterium]|jgi:tetratricopeptide (TPR) repeat protein|uniref:Tetratricopeptide repeat protein n=1 Tax=marine metagenome TaxID=408172 RepID=A0A381VX64_9ZZZZ|nr:hypothetical protein [Candidatus Neomarinimicrobiota bacterium]|tara:strand:+ start:52 stop:813 length:762 start_codon:yes stop_codon:yes gene_type:complete
MRQISIYLFLFSGIFAQSDLSKGITAYDRRHDGCIEDRAQTGPISEAIGVFTKALEQPETKNEAALYLLKSYYFKAKFSESDKGKKKELLKKGKELGQEFLDRFPDSVEYRYWYLVNLGSWAEVYGILSAAKEGVADQMRSHSEKIIEIDSDYKDGGGYFMLGAVHYKSPYIPFLLSWPDNDEAVKWLSKAAETGKATLNQKVYLAQALYKQKNSSEAIKLLETVSQAEPSENEYASDWEWIKKARGLLSDWQ